MNVETQIEKCVSRWDESQCFVKPYFFSFKNDSFWFLKSKVLHVNTVLIVTQKTTIFNGVKSPEIALHFIL